MFAYALRQSTLSCTLMIVTFSTIAQGMNINYGSEVALNIHKTGGTISNNGDWCALRTLSVHADTLKGVGNIFVHSIIIDTKKFEFTGTITCFGTCIINVEEPFDEKMFTYEGPGKIIINVGKEAHQKLPKEESISIAPLKQMLMKFPQNHPIQTVACGAIGVVCLAVYARSVLMQKNV